MLQSPPHCSLVINENIQTSCQMQACGTFIIRPTCMQHFLCGSEHPEITSGMEPLNPLRGISVL